MNAVMNQPIVSVDFPMDWADQVLGYMQSLYGAEFDKKYGGLSGEEVLNTACTVLNGLSLSDIQRGIARMSGEKWCPSLPEFRAWCIADDWWTADMAWAKCMQYLADNTVHITTVSKQALDEVRLVLEHEGQKAAHYAFKDFYDMYVQQAKQAGERQQMYVKPKAIAYRADKHHQPITPPPEFKALAKKMGMYKEVAV